MFSSRLNWDAPPNPLLQSLAAKRAAGAEILDLTESNPTRAGFDYSQLDLPTVLAHPDATRYQPSPRGLLAAREAIAGYYRGQRVHPDSIFLTASTSEAYSFLFKLLCNPGDEILVPQPGYPLFDFLSALDSVRQIYYPLSYDDALGWQINFERLRAAIGPRTRAIVVVNPNNPAGNYLKQRELAELNTLCTGRRLALIVDEVFSDYSHGADSQRVETAVGNEGALTFVLSGLSKIAGLPQMKLGWIQIGGPEPLVAAACARLEFIADTYLSVSASIQHAAPILLASRRHIQQQITSRIDGNYGWLNQQCAQSSKRQVLNREGGWYAVLEFHDSVSDDERVNQLLELDSVFVHPGYFYDFTREGYLVLSLITPTVTFRTGIERILSRWGFQ